MTKTTSIRIRPEFNDNPTLMAKARWEARKLIYSMFGHTLTEADKEKHPNQHVKTK